MRNDQAANLRKKIIELQETPKTAKTIAVVSGKGGVGKSNISLNLSLSLAEKGKKILLFDFDIGMGNINILMGNLSTKDLSHYLYDQAELKELIYPYTQNVSYISAGNGFSELIDIQPSKRSDLLNELEKLQTEYDYIIFDMGAGATKTVLHVLLSVDDIFVVTTPEPTAITDAYSMMKFIHMQQSGGRFLLICNRAENEQQGKSSLERLQLTVKKFLNREVKILGVLPEDKLVRQSVFEQKAFTVKYPKAKITNVFKKMVDIYVKESFMTDSKIENNFLHKLRRFIWKEM